MNIRNEVLAVFLLLALLLSGCGDPDRQKIIGVWEIETADKLIDRVGSKSPDSEDGVFNEGPVMSIQFGGDGRLKTSTRLAAINNEKSGTWELVSSNSNSIVISCTMEMQTTEHEVEFVDNETIKLTPPNMAGLKMKLTFSRKK